MSFLAPSSGVMRYYLMITTFYLVVWYVGRVSWSRLYTELHSSHILQAIPTLHPLLGYTNWPQQNTEIRVVDRRDHIRVRLRILDRSAILDLRTRKRMENMAGATVRAIWASRNHSAHMCAHVLLKLSWHWDSFSTAVDTIADLLVLVVPLQLLYVLQDRWLRSRLMIIFSTCMLTTIVSLVHAIFILTLKGPAIVIVALLAVRLSYQPKTHKSFWHYLSR